MIQQDLHFVWVTTHKTSSSKSRMRRELLQNISKNFRTLQLYFLLLKVFNLFSLISKSLRFLFSFLGALKTILSKNSSMEFADIIKICWQKVKKVKEFHSRTRKSKKKNQKKKKWDLSQSSTAADTEINDARARHVSSWKGSWWVGTTCVKQRAESACSRFCTK